ncbi:hypothetical protein TBLA_0E03370 [Henningerozyma blattae CBS 6284]|uniref:Sm domain-containing protein n=1 Tax=Henningerozyma blattae (strain ATCC 34711 / CBS 6284 / DSM 70876 / NBRC 10599 / NRRL Y-10934 / UCD 77-7) TaxID=1071380 RepID=I2H4T9_HENB6|nr:hypothetical protein TBLA_0E03370 [Tetrapisispora blattae CBS 6284]CCH61391.1 hypothetical protein TBLA_0E03370 [Tetrapisispora blattae CBS 6284]
MKLVNFLKKLRNEQLTIELKNGTTIWGTLQTVSPQMNVTLTDITLSLPTNKNPQAQAAFFLASNSNNTSSNSSSNSDIQLQYINVRGNTIRQIILPDSLNLDSLLIDEQQLQRLRKSGKLVDDSSKKRRRDYGTNTSKRLRRGI